MKNFKQFVNEGVRDKMIPKSKEEILGKFSNMFKTKLMKDYYFDSIEYTEKWIMDHIDEIAKLIASHPVDEIIDMLIDMTDIIKRKFNLKDGGIVDNGRNNHKSVIVNKGNIKEIFNFIKEESYWSIGGNYFELEQVWDIIDNMHDVKVVKLSIPKFSKGKSYDGRFKSYLSFTFDIGVKNNPSLVFDANSTESPYIWIRTSNYNWITISLDKLDWKDKIKKYL